MLADTCAAMNVNTLTKSSNVFYQNNRQRSIFSEFSSEKLTQPIKVHSLCICKQNSALWYTVKANNVKVCESNIRAYITFYVANIRVACNGNALKSQEIDQHLVKINVSCNEYKTTQQKKPIFDFRGILSRFWELQPILFGTKLFRDQFGIE